MVFQNTAVTHKRFGAGTVISLEGKALTVRFQQYGTRTFRFPDIFKTDLKTDDPIFARYAAEAMLQKE